MLTLARQYQSPLHDTPPIVQELATDGDGDVSHFISSPEGDSSTLKYDFEQAHKNTAVLIQTDRTREEILGISTEDLQDVQTVCSELQLAPARPGDGLLKGEPAGAFVGADGLTWPSETAAARLHESPYPALVQIIVSPRRESVTRPSDYRTRLIEGLDRSWLRNFIRLLVRGAKEDYYRDKSKLSVYREAVEKCVTGVGRPTLPALLT